MHPFQHLALSLSGGGYRATAFHLGSMAYLQQIRWRDKPLLSQLSVLSTISGGTITGMKYALCLAEGKSFETFYEELYQFLKEDQLLGRALATLNNDQAWQGSGKQRNLINAFALVYHRELLNEKTFKALLDLPAGKSPELIFNSTDLENQLVFRFQKSKNGLIGNGKINLPESAAHDLRLGDIVAASSCFPGGFEPLRFPQDFQDGSDGTLAQAWKDKPELRLLDGGIVDNQGIESVARFEDRHNKKGPYIGTWFVSDVTRKLLKYSEEDEAKGGHFLLNFSLRFYNVLAGILLAIACVALWIFMQKWIIVLFTALLMLSSLWLALSFLVVRFVVRLLKNTVSKHASSIRNLNLLREVKLKFVIAQLKTRLGSLGRLPDVFMKRIRDQGYNSLFSDKHWNYRVKTNLIYDLMETKTTLRGLLASQVKKANQMGTTLWFSEEPSEDTPPMLDALVATGKATMCHNLMYYLKEIKKRGMYPEEVMVELELVEKQCKADWAEMNV